MPASRKIAVLALGILLPAVAAACRTYRDATLDSVAIGDKVRVTDTQGVAHEFRVVEVDTGAIAGDAVRIEAGDVRSIEQEHRSLVPVAVAAGTLLLGALCLAGVTYPFWSLFVYG